MKLKIEVYGALCELSEFKINGKNAEHCEFGDKYDADPENAEDYGCGNMVFERNPVDPDVLKRYGITPKEYSEVCDKLEDLLSFGRCGWCV